MRVLITGGVKSGKSRRALQLAADFAPDRWFLATATAFDDEMRARIARHRAERVASSFTTIEEPIDIDTVLRERMVLDCIPMWLNNLFFAQREADWEPILDRLIVAMPLDIIIVTNETGMGVIPADPMSRRYGMVLGMANARLAAAVDRVELMVAGLPLRVK
ncbi:MAG TPA: bifunctional adenosylcobinamide kinase/adenosylcobinamide-phosphate guanylyltransferase [bacterium]|nr:bifunctional adenosylcobinamide kinase/adenosylcobinamide-phosphate guanylyltransferase [bacterium]